MPQPRVIRAAVSLLILAIFLGPAFGLYRLPFVERVEGMLYDSRLRLTMPNTVDTQIVIVDIDEKSLRKEGHWPWPRDRMAELVDGLFDDYGIQILGVDAVFAEEDESSDLKVLEELAASDLAEMREYASRLNSLRHDEIFAESLGRHSVVLGYFFNNTA